MGKWKVLLTGFLCFAVAVAGGVGLIAVDILING
jgi:hypothetical protein